MKILDIVKPDPCDVRDQIALELKALRMKIAEFNLKQNLLHDNSGNGGSGDLLDENDQT